MNKEKFILVVGHGRSGTSLCTGLLDSDPGCNFVYEMNTNGGIL